MERLQVLLALALVAAVAAPALAHGGRTTETKTSGSYEITHHTYVSVEQEEFVRMKWSVTEDGSEVDLAGETVNFEFYVDGSVERSEDFTLQDNETGVEYADISTGADTTRIDNTLPLPDGSSVTFSLTEVTGGSTNGGNGNGGNGNPLPMPAWLVPVALAGAALVLARRR